MWRGGSRMPKLTKRVIDEMSASTNEVILWDDALRGFGVRIQPTGIKSFLVQYRNAGARSRRMTLGRYGVLTVDEARKMARQILATVARGLDPVADKQSHREAPTVDKLVERYLSDHVDRHNSESMGKETRRLIERHVAPSLGKLKANGVTRSDVLKLHRAMNATPRQANFVLSILSKMFNLAEIWAIRPDHSNPCRGVPRYPETTRERFLSTDELHRLGRTLEIAEAEGLPWIIKASGSVLKHLPKNDANHRSPISPQAINIIRLLLLTGARRSEIVTLCWNHVDTELCKIALPDRKGGARRAHPVSTASLDILKTITPVDKSPWVFPRLNDVDRHVSVEVVENAWQRIRTHAGLPDVRLHDLRHTVGTYAGQAGVNAFLVRDLLRHKTAITTNRYVNKDDDPIRGISNLVGERIQAGLAGSTSSVVIPLKVKN